MEPWMIGLGKILLVLLAMFLVVKFSVWFINKNAPGSEMAKPGRE